MLKGPTVIGFNCCAGPSHLTVCTVLYCTVLYCTVLYCTVLYCTVLYCTVLYCTVLYCTVLYCTVLYCTVLYCTVLYCTVLYCTVLYCTVLYCFCIVFVLYCIHVILCKFIKWRSYIDRFHLTSRRPYWCTKTMKWRPYWCTVRELALSYSNISYCFTTPLGPPIT